jgi:hypothetical protein
MKSSAHGLIENKDSAGKNMRIGREQNCSENYDKNYYIVLLLTTWENSKYKS